MKRRVRRVLLILAAFLGLVWLNNTSLFSAGDDRPLLIAHRGLAPEMHPEHEDYSACISRIHASEHSYIENTIPSIEAAFDLGADYVEFDVRATADGKFAVFHDAESIHDLPKTPEYAELIPRGYGGAVKTNRIDKFRDWLAEAR